MKIAVEGCAHGELERIYKTLAVLEKKTGVTIDLLLCCGDFQAARNADDMESMAVPAKFKQMGSFYKYYTGELVAPILTVFIGGNHEASAHLQELSYGGWAAPNVYYMGTAGVVNIGGVRIGGLSGIYKSNDYMRGRHERPPYDERTKRSVYHVRQLDVFRLKQLKEPVDVMMSHDWPQGIEQHGNLKQLLRFKPFFENDINEGKLGNPPARELLNTLKPSYWFAGHLHCKYAAVVDHPSDDDSGETSKQTKFLSLDKCLPGRRFLQILDVPHDTGQPIRLRYDAEWLAVLRNTNHLLNVNSNVYYLPSKEGVPSDERYDFCPTPEEKTAVLALFAGGDGDHLAVPDNFVAASDARHQQANPQTAALCDLLGIDDPLWLASGRRWPRRTDGGCPPTVAMDGGDSNPADDDDDAQDSSPPPTPTAGSEDVAAEESALAVNNNNNGAALPLLVLPDPVNEDNGCPPEAAGAVTGSDVDNIADTAECRSNTFTGSSSNGGGAETCDREEEAEQKDETTKPKRLKRRNYRGGEDDDGDSG